MSNFREKAREIKAAGEAERGNFEPTGAPLRLYNYWLDNSSSNKAAQIKHGVRRENFCHFWRVVVIWAPLFFVFSVVFNVIDTLAFKIVASVVILGALAWAINVTGSWLVLGVLVGIILGAVALLLGGVYLHERFWQSRWNKAAEKVALGVLATLGIVVVLVGYGALILEYGFFNVLGVTLAIVGFLAALIFTFSKVSDYLAGRRKIKRDKQIAAEAKWICEGGTPPWETEPKGPSALSKILSGFADFIILISQIVRVKKWKICPMVDINAK